MRLRPQFQPAGRILVCTMSAHVAQALSLVRGDATT